MYMTITAFCSKIGREVPPVKIRVSSYQKASEAFLDFTDKNDLGESDCTDGKLFFNKVHVATVSYNGRVWVESERLNDLLYDPYLN